MFPMTPIAAALALLMCTSALAAPAASGAATPGSLITQAQGLPAGFSDHFFDVPLAVRVDLDQQPLGEALIVLSRDDRVAFEVGVLINGQATALMQIRNRSCAVGGGRW